MAKQRCLSALPKTSNLIPKPEKHWIMYAVKTREQIAIEFGISRKTLYNWLKNEKITIKSRLVSPKDLALIYERFGRPEQQRGWRN
jgi:hypothetical protein